MITVFFDGKCGLCRREIEYYRYIAPQKAFQWIDITTQPQPLLDLGITIQDGLMILYARDGDGKIHQGVDSFLLIWECIPRLRWLSRVVRIKPFYIIANFLYAKFASWHFTHMGYKKCDIWF